LRFLLAVLLFTLTWLILPVSVQAETSIRVRLKAHESELQISGIGLRIAGFSENFKPVAIPVSESIKIKRFNKDGHSFWLVTHPLRSQILASALVVIEGSQMRTGAMVLPNKILVAADGQGKKDKMDLVGLMPLETYLTGVVASEMPLQWPLETLKAQAVAARSYAMVAMKERSHKIFHVESSILDQVFRPLASENSQDPLVRKAVQAVRETEGQKLLTAQGKTLKAFYHSDCGGQTVSARSVWNSGVDSGETVDSACPTSPRANWKLTQEKEKIYANLKKYFFLSKSPLQIVGLDFQKTAGQERVRSVRVAFNEGESKTLSGNEFRSILGFQDLKSTLFEVEDRGSDFVFKGRGFGHGVGLCQWGSRALGAQGLKYGQILQHYYPLAKLARRQPL
jgi:stage II sporulation protein D